MVIDRFSDAEEDNPSMRVVTAFVMVTITVFAMISNMTLLGLFATKQKLKINSNMFIASLALADFGVAVAVLPLR